MSLKIIITVIIIGLILFVAALLYSILPRNKNASDISPFKEIISKTVTTVRPVVLMPAEKPEQVYAGYRIYDTIHKYSVIIENAKTKWILPVGTQVHITKAKLRYGSVAGVTTPFIIGTLAHPESGEQIEFEYAWGEESISRLFDNIKERWSFPLAFWQETENTNWYVLPSFR